MCLRADVRNVSRPSTPSRPASGRIARLLFTTRLQSVVLLRSAQWFEDVLPALALLLKYVKAVLTGADISPRASIGGGLRLFHPVGVVIGPDCRLGSNCTVMQARPLARAWAALQPSATMGSRRGRERFGALTIADGCVSARTPS